MNNSQISHLAPEGCAIRYAERGKTPWISGYRLNCESRKGGANHRANTHRAVEQNSQNQ